MTVGLEPQAEINAPKAKTNTEPRIVYVRPYTGTSAPEMSRLASDSKNEITPPSDSGVTHLE